MEAEVLTDREGVILAWNDAARSLYGYEAREAVGRHIRMLEHPRQAAAMADILARVLSGEVCQTETLHQAKDGGDLPVLARVEPRWDEEGRVLGVRKLVRAV